MGKSLLFSTQNTASSCVFAATKGWIAQGMLQKQMLEKEIEKEERVPISLLLWQDLSFEAELGGI